MADYQRYSRAERHKKKKSSKQKFFFFAMLAVVFCILLFSFIVFGNRESPPPAKETATNVTEEHDTSKEENRDDQENDGEEVEVQENDDPLSQTNVDDRVEEIDQENEAKIKELESNDSNVKRAYTGDWKPLGTKQEGPHTTNYNDQSEDRIEIKEAVSTVTNVEKENMIEHWVGNGGDQQVVATIQDKSNSEFYRVYLEWIDDEGWKPTKVEELNNFSRGNSDNKEEGQEEG